MDLPVIPGLQRTSRPGCTTGGSLQNSAAADPFRLCWPAALPWGPHPPYEGSQLARCSYMTCARNQSSSALRGIATTAGRDGGPRRARPHPPYEGSQLGGGLLPLVRQVLIRPMRDRNASWPVRIRRTARRSSSALRGADTCDGVLGGCGWYAGRRFAARGPAPTPHAPGGVAGGPWRRRAAPPLLIPNSPIRQSLDTTGRLIRSKINDVPRTQDRSCPLLASVLQPDAYRRL